MPRMIDGNSKVVKIVPYTKKLAVGRKEVSRTTERKFEFAGRHFIANYFGCDHAAMCNHTSLVDAMRKGVDASGATLLKLIEYTFSPSGFTALLLLSESHASIHTYPECDACFVDLFTCGRLCIAEKFHLVLREYLRPAGYLQKILLRGDTIEEDCF